MFRAINLYVRGWGRELMVGEYEKGHVKFNLRWPFVIREWNGFVGHLIPFLSRFH